MIARLMILLLFAIGMLALVVKRNLIKKTYALAVINSAVVLLFVFEGSAIGDAAPLREAMPRTEAATLRDAQLARDVSIAGDASIARSAAFVDPMPQALMLTAIVVGVCVSALALAFAWRLYKLYGTLDIDELSRRIGHE